MKPIISSLTLALATASVVLVSPTPALARAETVRVPTHYALNGAGFGTRVQGGQLPVGSDTTSYQALGCTNMAGIDRQNHVVAATVPGLGRVSAVTTRVWTTKNDGVVSSNTRSTVGRVVISDDQMGKLEINAITSLTRTFHDAKGFHATTSAGIGQILHTDPTGATQSYPDPQPGHDVLIPGLASLSVGGSNQRVTQSGAKAAANALDITVLASGTRTRVAHSAAQIGGGIIHGVFQGFSSATRARALDGNVSVGYQPLSLMPCQGTKGEVRRKAIASANLGNGVVASGLKSEQMGRQTDKATRGYEQGSVAQVNLGEGQLIVDAIVGRANVDRTAAGIVRTALGTSVGQVLFNGEPQNFPPSDVLEIPGVARLEQSIVKKSNTGIFVTALRITLLDGSGAVINLGQARLNIRNSGL